jgi:pyruvate dehydrogenase E2 component (dihydrolipoamide acetyltransferase)
MAIRTMMPISMTFDHRVMDGEPAARFARALHEAIEQPGLMLG